MGTVRRVEFAKKRRVTLLAKVTQIAAEISDAIGPSVTLQQVHPITKFLKIPFLVLFGTFVLLLKLLHLTCITTE